MRVLVLMPNWPAPSELWMHRMIGALGPGLAVVATYASPASTWGSRAPALSLLPAPVRPLSRLGVAPLIAGWGGRTLLRILEEWEISAVLCHYLPCALSFRAVWEHNRVPLFVHCHGYDVTWDLRLPRWPHLRRFGSGYVRAVRALSERAMIIANSDHTRRRLEAAGVAPARVVVKYLGVPVPERLAPRTTPPDHLDILYLGRLVDFKGPEQTIQAFDLACRKGLNGVLTIAGDGPLRRACVRAREASRFGERIRLLGVTTAEQGERLRAQADVFTAHNRPGPLTRQEEALGISIIEAMAAGLPVVTGRNGGVVETVVDGATGLLFEPGDVNAHATALLRLAGDLPLRLKLGTAGWLRAKDFFSDECERQRLSEILNATSASIHATSIDAGESVSL
ncbi:MAG: glycosyltransferase family 4 protein [Isosphaeraceae bacterium]|nr:glycosyltransferase family 4 protein [Isosphaeraceae bacterium]